MASAFSHVLVAYTANKFSCDTLLNKKFFFFVAVSSIMPDIDVLAFRFGIAYGDVWGHRGMTHSIFFAFIWSILLWLTLLRTADYKHFRLISKTSLIAITILFLSTSSHGFLDAMTNGGLGIAFFSPFNTTRYFLPWQPIQVSPIGVSAFFSHWGLRVILSELIWIGIPCFIVLLGIKLKNRIKNQAYK